MKKVLEDLPLHTYAFLPSEKAERAVVFFHGYGADGRDLFSLSPVLAGFFPQTAFYFPDAPERTGVFGGYQWFPLDDYDPLMLSDPERGEKYLNSLMPWAERTRAITDSYVNAILKHTKIPAHKLILCGFSQGGLMAIYTSLRFAQKLAGTIGLSSVAVMFDGQVFSKDRIVSRLPVTLIHGNADNVVPLTVFERHKKNLTDAGLVVNHFIVPGLMHGIDETALKHLIDAITSYFSVE